MLDGSEASDCHSVVSVSIPFPPLPWFINQTAGRKREKREKKAAISDSSNRRRVSRVSKWAWLLITQQHCVCLIFILSFVFPFFSVSTRCVQEERSVVQGWHRLLLQRRVSHTGPPVFSHLGHQLAILGGNLLLSVQWPGHQTGQLRTGHQRKTRQVHCRVSWGSRQNEGDTCLKINSLYLLPCCGSWCCFSHSWPHNWESLLTFIRF